jgi:hypothetical protein
MHLRTAHKNIKGMQEIGYKFKILQNLNWERDW